MLNSVKTCNSKTPVIIDGNQQITNYITITIFNISDALKNIKCDKSSGGDDISAEHFVFADSRIMFDFHCYFLLLLRMVTCHACSCKQQLCLLSKKIGDTSGEINYRPTALVTTASKVFELCLSEKLENYLFTHNQQFGLKANFQLTFAFLQQRVCPNTIHNTVQYVHAFLDASKAFDIISHFKLFRKLFDRKTPIAIMRILLFWYCKQTVYVKWRTCMSDYFCISNCVR